MTTIKSAFGKKLRVTDYDDGKLALTCAPDNDGSSDHVRVYDRAELLDALGAVPKGTPYAELAEQLHAATQRAEAAEAEVLEQAKLVRTFADRAEAAEAKLAKLQQSLKDSGYMHWLDRAEAAEATIQRVRDLDWYGHYSADYVRGLIANALDPVPPFTLPTEAGARFTATRTGIEYTFQTVTYRIPDGGMTLYIREGDLVGLTAKEVMADFTDHRLLGAEDA